MAFGSMVVNGGDFAMERIALVRGGGLRLAAGYDGTIRNLYALQGNDYSALYVENASPKVYNFTLVGDPSYSKPLVSFEDGAAGRYRNAILTNIGGSGILIRGCENGTFIQNTTLAQTPGTNLFWSEKNLVYTAGKATQISSSDSCVGVTLLSRNEDPQLFDPTADPRPMHSSPAFYTYDPEHMGMGNTKGDDILDTDEHLGTFSGLSNWMVGLSWLSYTGVLNEQVVLCPTGTGSTAGDVENVSECLLCPKHTYDNPFNNKCEACVFGSYAFGVGSTVCTQSVDFEKFCEDEAEGYYYER